MIEHIEELNLNEDYDCNSFGLAFDAYRKAPRPKKLKGVVCSPRAAQNQNRFSNL